VLSLRLKDIDNSEFLSLSISKKTDYITKLYFGKCSKKKIFVNGKLSKDYFYLKAYLKRECSESDIHKLYDYLISLSSFTEMSLTEVFTNAEKYRVTQVRTQDQEEVEEYPEKSIDDIMGW
jgi:hypothetical protein